MTEGVPKKVFEKEWLEWSRRKTRVIGSREGTGGEDSERKKLSQVVKGFESSDKNGSLTWFVSKGVIY